MCQLRGRIVFINIPFFRYHMSLCLKICQPVYPSPWISVCFSLCLYLSLCLRFVCLDRCPSLALVCLSVCLSVSFSLSLSLSIYFLYILLSIPIFLNHPVIYLQALVHLLPFDTHLLIFLYECLPLCIKNMNFIFYVSHFTANYLSLKVAKPGPRWR